MRVRIESVAEHWAQCPGKRRTANCLAASRLVSPAVRSEPLLTLASPLFETARGRFWCREALAAGTPRLQTPQFCSVRDFVVRATATRAHPSVDPSTDGKVVVCLVAPGGRES